MKTTHEFEMNGKRYETDLETLKLIRLYVQTKNSYMVTAMVAGGVGLGVVRVINENTMRSEVTSEDA